jgi:SAM-dependent methyltransferase
MAALGYQISYAGEGLEIAPYFDPFLSKSEHNVLYTDYIDNDEIRKKADENPSLKTQAIPEIDFVWVPGRPLKECAPEGKLFDYVVASHVMEHVPNPVGWLNELLSVTKVGGKVLLFLPDRRTNSDYRRSLTSFAQLYEWWLLQPGVPTPGQIADFMGESIDAGGWNFLEGPPPAIKRPYSDSELVNTTIFYRRNYGYIDIHASVWEPDQCRVAFERFAASGILNVSVSNPLSDPLEFAIVLTKLGEPQIMPPPADELAPQYRTQA